MTRSTAPFAPTQTHEAPAVWTSGDGEYGDLGYAFAPEGIAKITIRRPETCNALRPQTLRELSEALDRAQDDPKVGVVILTGEGTRAFCSGLDQRADEKPSHRFRVTDLHMQLRRLPKPVIAMVAGYAIGGGNVLHLLCDLTIAADNACFAQPGGSLASVDGGFGVSLLAGMIGTRRAKELWFLGERWSAEQALAVGMVNAVVPVELLEEETVRRCRRMLSMSPTGLRLLKASFNASEDGFAGLQQLAHDANLLLMESPEGREGQAASRERRPADFAEFPFRP